MNFRIVHPVFGRVFCLTPCLALLVTGALSSQTRTPAKSPTSNIQLMETGRFHGDEIKARTGEQWLGLYRVGDEHVLKLSRVRVERVNDPIVDEDERLKTGRAVSVDGKGEPILLVKGAAMLKSGPVRTVYVGEGNLTNTADMTLKLPGKEYRLKVETKDRSGIEAITSDDAKLVLIHGAERQVLYELGGKGAPAEAHWRLRWAGDLDGDGKIDVYVDASDHYNVSERRLFLSSKAQKGQLLEQVAVFRTVG